MGRKNRGQALQRANERIDQLERQVTATRVDGLVNELTGLGVEGRDKATGTTYRMGRIMDPAFLDGLYRTNADAARIVDILPDEATREWVEFRSKSEDKDLPTKVTAEMDRLELDLKFHEAGKWARLYGSSLILIGADDNQPPTAPLNEAGIRSIDFLKVLDGSQFSVWSRYQDAGHKKYNEPEFYRIHLVGAQAGDFLIHESRVLRFDGVRLSDRLMWANQGKADSIITRLWEALSDWGLVNKSAANLVHDFSVAIWKVKGLYNAIAAGKFDDIKKRIEANSLAMSIVNAIMLDADSEEQWERKTTNLTGLPDLMGRFEGRWAGVCDVPLTILFGQQAGKIAGAEQDESTWHKKVSVWQRRNYQAPLTRVFKLMFLAKQGPTGGAEPKGWEYRWKPLKQMSAKETAEFRKVVIDTAAIAIDRGILYPEEVAVALYGGDEFNQDFVLDLDARTADKKRAEEEEKRIKEEERKKAKAGGEGNGDE